MIRRSPPRPGTRQAQPTPPSRASTPESRSSLADDARGLSLDEFHERGQRLGHRPSISADGGVAWSPAPIRRAIPNKSYQGENAEAVESFATALNDAVQKAAAAIMTSPLLGVYADYDGHTARWVELIDYLAQNNENPGGLAAAFGYAVESLSTGPLLPAAPGGMTIALQGSRGGTRPDVILIKSAVDVAWLDITAWESRGHIFDKEGAWQQAESYAEITYPSLTDSDYLEMAKSIQSDPDKSLDFEGVDAEAAFAQARAAKEALAKKQTEWHSTAVELLAPVKKISIRGMNATSGPGERRASATELLAGWLGIEDLQQSVAASVLWALDLNPMTYGFLDSVSRGTGLAILQDADPDVDVSTEMEED